MSNIPPATRCTYPVRPGNAVFPLVDGLPAFERICAAAEQAKHSVWVTVAFIEQDMQFPGGRGTFFQFMQRLHDQGLDVRVLFWRCPEWPEADGVFNGIDGDRDWLAEQGISFRARWDWLPNALCHHQKSWVIDGRTADAMAFVGGINLGESSLRTPGHDHERAGTHDVYLEIQGPAASDVVHNFVQRWNHPSERDKDDGYWPDAATADQLAYPKKLVNERGNADVQISRTIRKQQAYEAVAPIGAPPFPLEGNERSTLETYINAIAGAQSSIYIEDQAIAADKVLMPLIQAAKRGVEILVLVPTPAFGGYSISRQHEPELPMFKLLDELAQYPNFSLAGITRCKAPGVYDDIYVHAKIMLVDDVWTTIGSCNFGDRSFYGDTELNASFWDADVTRRLRGSLHAEHIGINTTDRTDVEALQLFRTIAAKNRIARDNNASFDTLAVRLDPNSYGLDALTRVSTGVS